MSMGSVKYILLELFSNDLLWWLKVAKQAKKPIPTLYPFRVSQPHRHHDGNKVPGPF